MFGPLTIQYRTRRGAIREINYMEDDHYLPSSIYDITDFDCSEARLILIAESRAVASEVIDQNYADIIDHKIVVMGNICKSAKHLLNLIAVRHNTPMLYIHDCDPVGLSRYRGTYLF